MQIGFDGEKIEKRRIECGLSKAELCRRAKVSRDTYYKLIGNGNVRIPYALIVLQELHLDLSDVVK